MDFYGVNINSINLNSLSFGVGLTNKNVALGLFGLVVFFVAMITIIMFWHWNKYSMRKGGTFMIEILYLIGSASLIISAFTFLNKI